jgi:glycosyltransferase involved in cell wall biosynthesis
VIDVILPVHNEAEALPWVLDRIPSGYRPLVVDNASTDRSGALARTLGARVVEEPVPGFGSACFAGLVAAGTDIVCFMDCDASLDPAELPTVTGPVEHASVDLVVGERQPDAGAWSWHLRAVNRMLAFEVRRRTGCRLHDLGPMRAARRQPLLELGIIDRRSGWPLEMVVVAARAGWRIAGVPTRYAPRSGQSKVTGTARGFVGAFADMAHVLRNHG